MSSRRDSWPNIANRLFRSEFERLFKDQLTRIVKVLEEALDGFEKDDTHDAVVRHDVDQTAKVAVG